MCIKQWKRCHDLMYWPTWIVPTTYVMWGLKMRLSLGANLRHRGDLNSRFGNLWSHLPSFTPPTNLFAERGMSLKVTHGHGLPTSFEQDELERKKTQSSSQWGRGRENNGKILYQVMVTAQSQEKSFSWTKNLRCAAIKCIWKYARVIFRGFVGWNLLQR